MATEKEMTERAQRYMPNQEDFSETEALLAMYIARDLLQADPIVRLTKQQTLGNALRLVLAAVDAATRAESELVQEHGN